MHLLVALDDSPAAERALNHALDRYPDADVTVLHVLDPVEAVYRAEGAGPVPATDWVETARDDAERLLSRAAETAREKGVTVETEIDAGKPARAIVDYVGEHDVDHVVMGSHGRRGLSRVVLGSVAESVVHRTPVDVTVIRAGVRDE